MRVNPPAAPVKARKRATTAARGATHENHVLLRQRSAGQ